MVNLEWYRTFKAIYEEGTLTAAATSLFISQPGVSLHLSSLESHIGEKLFDRVSKKMIPTEKGKVLYNALIDPLNAILSVEQQFQRTIENDTPTITLGMCFETFQQNFEPHLHTFGFNLVNRFSDYKSLHTELERGLVDVIVTPHSSSSKEIQFHPVMTEQIVLIGSNDIDKKEVDDVIKGGDVKTIESYLHNQTWYGAASDNEHFLRFWRTNLKQTPKFRQNFIVPNFISIVRSLSYGTGIAIVPDFLAVQAIEECKVQMLWKGSTPVTNQLYIAFRKDSVYKEQIDKIRRVFEEI